MRLWFGDGAGRKGGVAGGLLFPGGGESDEDDETVGDGIGVGDDDIESWIIFKYILHSKTLIFSRHI